MPMISVMARVTPKATRSAALEASGIVSGAGYMNIATTIRK